ncbi:MAG: hypothetical protein J6X40_05185 [Bacteroidales bacterium]|nr:hypothetical protein [Bacteroidales bacterium]
MKPSLKDPVFNRGCCKMRGEFEPGKAVLNRSACKLNEYNWMKDYEGVAVEGQPLFVEVRFKNDHKDFYTYPEELDLHEGDLVAVEAAIGHDIGIVTMVGPLVERQMKRKRFRTPLEEMKKVYRRARANDVEKWLAAIALEDSTLYRTRTIAENLGLEMKLNDIEYQGDKTKAIFYYTADGRVDFRELIKKLAEEFHIRVEMRQIGVRQESAKLGGIGSCGRELCCASWISSFQSVTTNVARVQQLSPNPQKLAGQCGKLKCCLNYEYEAYVDALKAFPEANMLKFKNGDAVHQKNDVFKGIMWYSYTNDKGNIMAIPVDKVKEILEKNKRGEQPEKLEDYAVTREQMTNTNEGYSERDLNKMSD